MTPFKFYIVKQKLSVDTRHTESLSPGHVDSPAERYSSRVAEKDVGGCAIFRCPSSAMRLLGLPFLHDRAMYGDVFQIGAPQCRVLNFGRAGLNQFIRTL